MTRQFLRIITSCPSCNTAWMNYDALADIWFLSYSQDNYCKFCGEQIKALKIFACSIPDEFRGDENLCTACEFRYLCFVGELGTYVEEFDKKVNE